MNSDYKVTTWRIVWTFACWFTFWFLPFILLLHNLNFRSKDCKYIFKEELCYLAELNAVQSCTWMISKEIWQSTQQPKPSNEAEEQKSNWFKLLLSRGKNYWLALEQEECGLCKTQSIGLVSPGSPGLPLPRCSDKPDQMLFLAKQLKEKCIFVAFSSALWNHKATCREKYFPRPVSAAIFPI